MKYIVKVTIGYREMEFEFTDSIKANMFASMALNNMVKPEPRYDGDSVDTEVTITLVKAEEQEAPAAENKEEQ